MPSRSPRRPPLVPIALLLAAAGTAGAAAADTPPADPARVLNRALAEAQRGLDQNESELAESRFRTAIHEGWLLLGTMAADAGDASGARRAFERAGAAVVDDRRALIALAVFELRDGRPDPAIGLLRRLAARDPADAEVRELLARALVAAGDLDAAVQELEELRVRAPDRLETLYTLATAYLRLGRPEAAEPLFLELAAARPLAETHVLIGRTYRDHGDYPSARAALETALELDPEVPRAHYYLGTVALLAEGRGRIDEAIEEFRAELEIDPDDPMASLYLGIGLVESRRYEEALTSLRRATGAAVSRRHAWQFLGEAELALDRPAEAAEALGRALELARAETAAPGVEGGPDESELSGIHYQLGLALRRTGRPEEAAVHFARAKEHSARLAESSREFLARYLAETTREDERSSLRQALAPTLLAGLAPAERQRLARQLETELARAYFNLGVLKTRERRFAGAARLFAAAAELAPDLPRLHYSLGVALFNSGRFAAAREPLERATAADPKDATLRRMLALAHLNGGSPERAVELLRGDAERSAEPALDYAYAQALVRSQRPEEAEPVFARLLARNPDWPELHVVLGQASAQQGDFAAAERSLERALELEPRVAGAHAALGDIYLRQGRLSEATAALRAELEAHPGDERARLILATALDLDRQPEEAKGVLRAHLAARPSSADGRYLLGKILLAEGDAAAALEQLEAAAELAPDDANVRYQLGQALQKLGQLEEAQREFQAFQELKQASRREERR